MTPEQFVAKWSACELSEKAASHEHFIDLCQMLGVPTPASSDPTGQDYCFEKPVRTTAPASKGSKGDYGFVDVWKRNCFAWEYKRKDKYKSLDDAYRQLYQYRDDLENPPLSVVCDISNTVIHTHFQGYPKRTIILKLEEIPGNTETLRRLFNAPDSFKPAKTAATLTQDVAEEFGKLADALRDRFPDTGPGAVHPHHIAHFLMKIIFCLFAEGIDLLPGQAFKRLIKRCQLDAESGPKRLDQLFTLMRTGGEFGNDLIPWFNGGLFDDAPAIPLKYGDFNTLAKIAEKDWSGVEPSIFGTLFERILDPNKRAQIGAHYTGRDDILLVVEPVVMAPLRRRWQTLQDELQPAIDQIIAHCQLPANPRKTPARHAERTRETSGPEVQTAPLPSTSKMSNADFKTLRKQVENKLQEFRHYLATLRILDPACGSGNFLYVALQLLLDLDYEIQRFATRCGIPLPALPYIRPSQTLHGIEINAYASELAQVVIWIGYIQWLRDHGLDVPNQPILDKLQSIENRDAILDFLPSAAGARSAASAPTGSPSTAAGAATGGVPGTPATCHPERTRKGSGRDVPIPPIRHTASPSPQSEIPPLKSQISNSKSEISSPLATPALWPPADFIIGNPPFLGSKLFRKQGLPDHYLAALYAAYDLPKTSDLCCYWFELARRQIEQHPTTRAGLLATQGIRGGDNRTVLERIKEKGDIFMAWSDRNWILDGAAVHVSMIGFDGGVETERTLDGATIAFINPDLSSGASLPGAKILPENLGIAFMGTTKGGAFELDWAEARELLAQPNPSGRTNDAVVRPWVNGSDLTKRGRAMWVVDFGCESPREEAAQYAAPFALIETRVLPKRSKIRAQAEAKTWWLHNRSRGEMRTALDPLARFIVTCRVAKHRIFAWFTHPTLPDSATFAFARSDDYFFGVLHSSVHELWARRMGTQLREAESGFRYTPTTCFETFPLPWAPGQEPVSLSPNAHGACSVGSPAKPASTNTSRTKPASAKADPTQIHNSAVGSALRTISTPRQPQGPSPQTIRNADPTQLHAAISTAAAELNTLRENWLNPPEWIKPLEERIDATDDFSDVPPAARPLIRHSTLMALAAKDDRLKKRTLTNLYNQRPTWLKLAHQKLDRAVLAAYAATDPEGDWSQDWSDVYVDTGAGQPLPAEHALITHRAEIDRRVLENLLRLNLERSGRLRDQA